MNHPQEPQAAITLHITITNGDPRQDARLKFQFQPLAPGQAKLWVMGLPQVASPDAVARQVAPHAWALKLDARAGTRPVGVVSYTSDHAGDLLQRFVRPEGGSPAELLILAREGKFTIALTEFYGESSENLGPINPHETSV
jgi:hypothetical protein